MARKRRPVDGRASAGDTALAVALAREPWQKTSERKQVARALATKEKEETRWDTFIRLSDDALDARFLGALAAEPHWPTFSPPEPDEDEVMRAARLSVQGMRARRRKYLPDKARHGLTIPEVADRIEAPLQSAQDAVVERLLCAVERLHAAGKIRIFLRARDGKRLDSPVYTLAPEPRLPKPCRAARLPRREAPRGYQDQRFKLEQFKNEFPLIRSLSARRARELIRTGKVEGVCRARTGKGYFLSHETVKAIRRA